MSNTNLDYKYTGIHNPLNTNQTHGNHSHTLPTINLTRDPKALQPCSPEWNQLCRSICEALEKHGGLLLDCDVIPTELTEKMFSVIPELLGLPVETKRKNAATCPVYYTYVEPNGYFPHYEALGAINSYQAEGAREFTELMWADGNEDFCKILYSISIQFMELFKIVFKMIFDSYGAVMHYESQIESLSTLFRMTRYTPRSKDEPDLGIPPHTDGTFLTILCQNDVHGLQFQSREGEWFTVNPGKGSFIIFVGQAFRAWSNGRLYSVPHRVILSDEKDRLSCGLFIMPKGDQIVKAPDELIDDKHPPLFKPFKYINFLEYHLANPGAADVLQTIATNL